MRTSEPLTHPADLVTDCSLITPQRGFASNKEYIYAYPTSSRPIQARGFGYGYGDTQLEADDMAWKRAIEQATKLLKFKLGIACNANINK